MAIQNKKSIYEEFSFEDMNKFRKDAFKTMELYNLTPRSINMDLIEANEEIAIQIFLYGADLARFLHEEEMSVADDDIDFMQKAFILYRMKCLQKRCLLSPNTMKML